VIECSVMHQERQELGFTLVELMVSTVVALVVLGGLLFSFQSQYGEYKYQNKRVDAAQDLEVTLTFIGADLRSALHFGAPIAGALADNPIETNGFSNGSVATADLYFTVWEPNGAYQPDPTTMQARRHYHYDAVNKMICYDRSVFAPSTDNTLTAAGLCNVNQEVLWDVTFFKVFQDAAAVSNTVTPRVGFTGIPNALPSWNILDIASSVVSVPSYTILIEVAVDVGYKSGSFLDVNGVDVRTTADKRKRIWRYVQVHPKSAI